MALTKGQRDREFKGTGRPPTTRTLVLQCQSMPSVIAAAVKLLAFTVKTNGLISPILVGLRGSLAPGHSFEVSNSAKA